MREYSFRIRRSFSRVVSRFKLANLSGSAVAVSLLLIAFTGCRHPKSNSSPKAHAEPPPPPKVTYSETYDPEIKEILSLGKEGKWEVAQAKANALYEKDPKNALV